MKPNLDWLIWGLGSVIFVLILLFVLVIVYGIIHPCTRTEKRWQEAYVTFITVYVGDTHQLIPQYHPAG